MNVEISLWVNIVFAVILTITLVFLFNYSPDYTAVAPAEGTVGVAVVL